MDWSQLLPWASTLVLGFAGWCIRLEVRLSLQAQELASAKNSMTILERDRDGFRDVIATIREGQAVMNEKITRLLELAERHQ